jgi:acetyl esterase/lipase
LRRNYGIHGHDALIMTFALAASAAALALAGGGHAEQPKAAALQVPAFSLPFSSEASPQARAIAAKVFALKPPEFGNDIAAARAYWGRYNDERLGEMRQDFQVKIEHQTLGGVGVEVVTPVAGIAANNRNRVLINVHGGGFMWGAGSGALVEAIPIAATGRIEVVAIDYRLAPEHVFPAASEDVAAVYKALLGHHRAESIGIYGCSAGGVITAQAVAWFQTHHLPRPGAIATMCGTGEGIGGDSLFLAAAATGQPVPPPSTASLRGVPGPYMAHAALSDPMAYPDDAVLRRFPPTLLLAGGRDFMASSLTDMHRRLAAQGVPSELFLFDGLWHAFFVWPDMPESHEAYRLITGFFDRQLAQ